MSNIRIRRSPDDEEQVLEDDDPILQQLPDWLVRALDRYEYTVVLPDGEEPECAGP